MHELPGLSIRPVLHPEPRQNPTHNTSKLTAKQKPCLEGRLAPRDDSLRLGNRPQAYQSHHTGIASEACKAARALHISQADCS